MKIFCFLIASLLGMSTMLVEAGDFTISSYNCGGLSAHYDYLRAAALQKLMRERYMAEPENMALNESIQQVALKRLFSEDEEELSQAQEEWDRKDYQDLFEQLIMSPEKKHSPNTFWNQQSEKMMTTYRVRPVSIYDAEVYEMLVEHMKDLTRNKDEEQLPLKEVRHIMAKRIFSRELKHDIICLQEADYLDSSVFPEDYEVRMSEGPSKNGIAWNTKRFDMNEIIGDIAGRAFIVELLDNESNKKVLVASCHASGCNPYQLDADPKTGRSDAAKGDAEIQAVIKLFGKRKADIKLIGMDSNVTAMHPRLNILKEAGYRLDSKNYLEGTCTNPYTILDTRIDWIFVKSEENVLILNIPVHGVGLNNFQTNMSDHKPVAAKIQF